MRENVHEFEAPIHPPESCASLGMRLPRNGDLLPTPQQDISVSPGHRHTFDGRRSNAVLCLVFVIQIEPPLLRLGDAFDLRTTFHEEGLETLPRKDSA